MLTEKDGTQRLNLYLYVMTLERKAKSNDYSAGMLFYCPDDATVLLLKRAPQMRHPNEWDIPGGRADKTDSDVLHTARREVLEELSTLPKNKRLLTKYVIHKSKTSNKYHVFVYAISQETKQRWHNQIKLDKESSEFKWFHLTKLPDNLRYDFSWITDAISEHGRIKIANVLNKIEYTLPRFELKFLVPETLVPEIKEFLEPYIEADEHGKFYQINNIYFDTDNLDFCANHLLESDRFKLRIRTYNDSSDGFLEIKRKNHDQIIKTRNEFKADKYPQILHDPSLRFNQLAQQHNVSPKLIINYLREAYFLKSDPTVRITFDRHIKYKTTDSAELHQSGDHSIFPNATVVMEIKFYHRMPEIVKHLIDKFKLERQPVSKYINSIVDIMFDKHSNWLPSELMSQLFNLLIKTRRTI